MTESEIRRICREEISRALGCAKAAAEVPVRDYSEALEELQLCEPDFGEVDPTEQYHAAVRSGRLVPRK